MTDGLKLKYLIIKSGYSVDNFAKMLGITRQSLYAKMSNDRGFDQEQIAKISDLLGLTSDEMKEIFFNNDVHKMSHD